MTFRIGKLYQIKQYFWMVYPSKDIANVAAARCAYATDTERLAAAYCSRQLNCNVTYIPKNGIFCLLEQDENYLKILSTNGELGWIIYPKNEAWTKGCIEEVKQ